MRIIKLSGEVFGFDTIEGCKAYFKHVLAWQKGLFRFAGSGNKIAKDKLAKNENVLFSYNGKIIAIAKAIEPDVKNDKVTGIKLDMRMLKIFENPIDSFSLEQELRKYGFTDSIYGSQGWNIIDDHYEKYVLNFLKNEEWKVY